MQMRMDDGFGGGGGGDDGFKTSKRKADANAIYGPFWGVSIPFPNSISGPFWGVTLLATTTKQWQIRGRVAVKIAN